MSAEHVSATLQNPHEGAQHSDHDDHDDDGAHGTVAGYVNGFILSVVLTAIPFWLVMSGGVISSGVTALVLLVFAAVQIVVHMVYFLHMNTKSEHGWSILALIFTVVLVVIMLAGSLWVMYHLNTNMMPMSPHEMRNAP
jgi:cytochrome o ubiquinol oxidase operon protein cyoD